MRCRINRLFESRRQSQAVKSSRFTHLFAQSKQVKSPRNTYDLMLPHRQSILDGSQVLQPESVSRRAQTPLYSAQTASISENFKPEAKFLNN